MLRAAKRINIQVKTFQNYDGFLLAPVIDINGLILSAEQTVDPRIKTFIESKGGKMNRVRINGELLVRLTGEFNITRQEVSDFIRESAATGAALPGIVENPPLLPQFAAMIDRDMQAEKAQGSVLLFSDSSYQIRIDRPTTESGDDTMLSAARGIKSGVFGGFSGKSTHYTAVSISMGANQLIGFSDTCVGYMGVLYAKKYISLTSIVNTSIENHIVSSMETLSLQGGEDGNLELKMNRSVEWLNNPYPEQFNGDLKHTPGKVRLS